MGSMCRSEPSSTPSRSAGRGSGGGSSSASTLDKIATDIKMGLSTIGQSKEQQAQTFRDQGYSESAIQSYQERTAASSAAAQAEMDRISRDDKPSAAPAAETEKEEEKAAPAVTTPAPPAPPTYTPPTYVSPYTVYGGAGSSTAAGARAEAAGLRAVAQGPAEAAVADTIEAGRRSTIETAPKGLTTAAKTRKKRSMISGEELEEGLLN